MFAITSETNPWTKFSYNNNRIKSQILSSKTQISISSTRSNWNLTLNRIMYQTIRNLMVNKHLWFYEIFSENFDVTVPNKNENKFDFWMNLWLNSVMDRINNDSCSDTTCDNTIFTAEFTSQVLDLVSMCSWCLCVFWERNWDKSCWLELMCVKMAQKVMITKELRVFIVLSIQLC